jgi:hypothetical protein
MIRFKEARGRALTAGGTDAEIDAQVPGWARTVGTPAFERMIFALNLHPWRNGRKEWVRLAAALKAKAEVTTRRRKGYPDARR